MNNITKNKDFFYFWLNHPSTVHVNYALCKYSTQSKNMNFHWLEKKQMLKNNVGCPVDDSYDSPAHTWSIPRISICSLFKTLACEHKVVVELWRLRKMRVLKWTRRSYVRANYITLYIMPVIKIMPDYIFPCIGMTINQASMTDIWLFGMEMAGNVYEQIKGP